MDEWRGFITKVLYCTQFSPRLDEGEAARVNALIAKGVLGDDPPARRTRMLTEALRSPERLTDGDWQPHGEPEVRAFLAALLTGLGAGPSA
ncbi:hypothetical protein ACFUN8_35025 [Streptomyces sp. NPDC057307]|uniref:hypothetical protein n=1 Tax=Streptomyces sp. NPDC057307 TaxID=3346096 RepID=UPI0036399729